MFQQESECPVGDASAFARIFGASKIHRDVMVPQLKVSQKRVEEWQRQWFAPLYAHRYNQRFCMQVWHLVAREVWLKGGKTKMLIGLVFARTFSGAFFASFFGPIDDAFENFSTKIMGCMFAALVSIMMSAMLIPELYNGQWHALNGLLWPTPQASGTL